MLNFTRSISLDDIVSRIENTVCYFGPLEVFRLDYKKTTGETFRSELLYFSRTVTYFCRPVVKFLFGDRKTPNRT